VISLHHVAVIVTDVDKAKDFYRKSFLLEEKERLTARVSQHKGAWFRLGNLELHLQERTSPFEKSEQHFALLTDEFEAVIERVTRFGGRWESAKLVDGFQKRCFLYDLDDNRIELLAH
jgi:glyoxylase I family protein